MSVYMTEEEQIESIKQWWKKYGNYITATLSVILLLIAGARYWNWHQDKVKTQASIAYEHMMISYTNQKAKETQAYANELLKQYGRTTYADAARLLLAKQLVEKKQYQQARDYLNTVVQSSTMPAFQQIARTRLARLLLVNQQYQEAIDTLSTVPDTAYLPLINELKGDIYTAMGESDKALSFYAHAIKEAREQNMGNLFLEMKTNELAAGSQAARVQRDVSQTV
ncbi:MAG: tetratricopeptide repeat protein [Legionellaceae bacterium]|nr:tetratricopeptide repeat protein [Legionellaceae bacterium]